MSDLVVRKNLPDVIEVIEGELIDVVTCPRCGEQHGVVLGTMRCCCGDEHGADICCLCGHFHDSGPCPLAPCGDYRCCIN
jgi:hypothetical protein